MTISIPAIEPAMWTFPVMNQLIANVSSVPKVRQLTALSTDRIWVSAPRNKATRRAPCLTTSEPITPALPGRFRLREFAHGQAAGIRAFWRKNFRKLVELPDQLRRTRKALALGGCKLIGRRKG